MNPSRSREIDLSAATAGMALAAALLDANGGVLVSQNTTLTEGMLAALRRRGVQRCVVWVEDALDAAALAQERERRLRRLEWLFRHSAASGGDARLLAQLRAYRDLEAR